MIPKYTPIFLIVCVLVMTSVLLLWSWLLPARLLPTPYPTSRCNITTQGCYSIRNRRPRNTTYPALLVAHNIMGIPADITHLSGGSQDAHVSKKGSAGNENVTGIAFGYAKTKWPVLNSESIIKIPESHYHPGYIIKWDFDSSRLLQREDVRRAPPKVITWMAKTRYMPSLPEPVRLRFCPEMPCRITTNLTYAAHGAALLWNAPNLHAAAPPPRGNTDQVYVFHNQECQTPEQTRRSTFHKQAWKSAFNWTMTYRFDSDIMAPYGLLVKRPTPSLKNYTAVLANKTRLVSWMVSHCETHGEREAYVKLLERHLPVHKYGGCGAFKCARSEDDVCLQRVTSTYKFFLAFENALCKDYITEKMFRYYDTDMVVVVRGSDDYQHLAPPDTYINTADFRSAKELADYLLYLDSHPEEYIKILKAKDEYVALYEDYTHIMGQPYVHYHYEAIPYCEMCRRLWDLDRHRKIITDIEAWFDKGNCYAPNDLT